MLLGYRKAHQDRFSKEIKIGSSWIYESRSQYGMANPSYRQVCSGSTGHVEVLELKLQDPDKHYEEVLKFFFQFHDPTTMNRQGNDAETQYASYISTNGEDQLIIANRVKEEP